MQEQTNDTAPRNLLTVEQMAARWPAWTQQALRALILNAEDRLNSRGERIHGNGLAEAGAIVRIGRRVLIDDQAWQRWIVAQQRARRSDSGRARNASEERAAA